MGGAFPGAAFASTPRAIVKPPRVKRGDVIALVSPSGVVNDTQLQRAHANLEALGFRVKLGKHVRAARGGYAGTVAERIEDLHAAFMDREAKAVWAARGGSGAQALVPHIDYGLVARHPKPFIGFSDLTALHLAIHAKTGLVTFHGPVASSTNSDFTRWNVGSTITEPLPMRELSTGAFPVVQRTLHGGSATGRLVGGNLSVLSAMVGTPWMPRVDGSLLFLEEVSEAPYRVDRMLMQLEQAGMLRRAAGLALGVFNKCVPPDNEPSLTLDEVLDDRIAAAKRPAAYGLSIGHIPQQVTVPLGVRARLDADAKTVTLLETAVS